MKRTALTLSLAFAACLCLATSAARAQDAQAGAGKVSMCVGCHGIIGYQTGFPKVYKVPKIAGQKADYLVAALTEYRHGDRRHPTMRAIAASLTDKDIADIAAYYERLGHERLGSSVPSAPVPAAPQTQPPEKLRAKLAACTACHGANFSSPTGPAIPRLAGQHPDYLHNALQAYQTSGNPNFGRSNAVMNGMAATLDKDDLEAVGDYLASLPGELKTVPEPRFR